MHISFEKLLNEIEGTAPPAVDIETGIADIVHKRFAGRRVLATKYRVMLVGVALALSFTSLSFNEAIREWLFDPPTVADTATVNTPQFAIDVEPNTNKVQIVMGFPWALVVRSLDDRDLIITGLAINNVEKDVAAMLGPHATDTLGLDKDLKLAEIKGMSHDNRHMKLGDVWHCGLKDEVVKVEIRTDIGTSVWRLHP